MAEAKDALTGVTSDTRRGIGKSISPQLLRKLDRSALRQLGMVVTSVDQMCPCHRHNAGKLAW